MAVMVLDAVMPADRVHHGVAFTAVVMSHRVVQGVLDRTVRTATVADVNAGPMRHAAVMLHVVMRAAAVMTGNAAAAVMTGNAAAAVMTGNAAAAVMTGNAAAAVVSGETVVRHTSKLRRSGAAPFRSRTVWCVVAALGVQQRGPQPGHRFRTDTATAGMLPPAGIGDQLNDAHVGQSAAECVAERRCCSWKAQRSATHSG